MLRSSVVSFVLLLLSSWSCPVRALIRDDNRLIAYMGNWQSCPNDEQLAQYTHLMVGFAITYQFSPIQNICSRTCEIETTPICDNTPQPQVIRRFKEEHGGKVILSFGGAGMGGSWAGDRNDCWDYCFGREDYVVDRLVELVVQLNMDGVDIDYEYFYQNNPPNRPQWNRGPEAIEFLRKVTIGLYQKLPDGMELTHAPMDIDMRKGTAYYNLLKEISYTLDFIMPQMYNGVTRAHLDGFTRNGQGDVAAIDIYQDLIYEVFGGDATRVVFGFCIDDCGLTGSNANRDQAYRVMDELQRHYPCNGGAFFWALEDDVRGTWSEEVNKAMDFNRYCTTGPGTDGEIRDISGPTVSPTRAPVSSPPVYTNTNGFYPTYQSDKKGPDFFDPNNLSAAGAKCYLGAMLTMAAGMMFWL